MAAAALAGGCTTLPSRPDGLAACQRAFVASDARIRAAGAVDADARRVPGFPYLRVNRFLASYRGELDSPRAVRAWAYRMRRLDAESRGIELRRVHDGPDARRRTRRLAECGDRLLRADLADPARRAQLRDHATAPDAYSSLARVLGLYPLAAAFLKLGIAAHKADVRTRFEQAEAPPEGEGDRRAYVPRTADVPSRARVAAWLSEARVAGPLDIPTLSNQQRRAVARRYAPRWLIRTRGAYDQPGAPVRTATGLDVARERVPVYWRTGYQRFGGRVLLQISYTIWFARRPAAGWLDPLAGRLDGVVWRVTLDRRARPLLHDSIHSCGCYHLVFPTKRLRRRGMTDFWREKPTFIDAGPSRGRADLRLQSGSHYLEAVTQSPAGPAQARRYRLVPYDVLRRRRPPLFRADGVIAGSERLERFFLWPSGVVSPGAMRQAGSHATAFVGRRHFDDPYLVRRLFRPR